MNNPPRVSVIIPCYRAAAFVGQSVESVLAQDIEDIQIVCVNDGSPDSVELRSALAPYGERIELIDRPHRGTPAARNRGIAVARAPLLAFLDADDAWKPGFLEHQLGVLEETGADLVYCDAEMFGESSEAGHTVMAEYPSSGDADAVALLSGECLVIMSTVVARTEAVQAVGGFDESLDLGEDFDLWLRMANAGSTIAYTRDVLALRRIHGENVSGDTVGMTRSVLGIMERHMGEAGLSDADARAVRRRVRRLRGNLHMELARGALQDGELRRVRAELWRSVRHGMGVKRLLGALAFTFFPGVSRRLIERRSRTDAEAAG